MRCSVCQTFTYVVDSRPHLRLARRDLTPKQRESLQKLLQNKSVFWRKRECKGCGRTTTTLELEQHVIALLLVDNPGDRVAGHKGEVDNATAG